MTELPEKLSFDEFPPAGREQWRLLVDRVLKGAAYEKKLVAKTYDGLRIEPVYPRRTDAAAVRASDSRRGLAGGAAY